MTNPIPVARQLNTYFSTTFTIDNSVSPSFPLRTHSTLDTITFTPTQVYKVLRALKPSVALGPDAIPNLILKRCAKPLSNPLAHIFDSSFKNGVLPSSWKTAIIHPLLKKTPSSNPANYRPLSMTSPICRSMEAVVNEQLVSYLSSNDLISSSQHGFRKKRSTTGNLLESVHDWATTMQKTGRTDLIYIDFQKAFDSISHHKLLIKLQAYGITGLLLQWIGELLRGRTQRVKVASVLSDALPVTSGVPQGSVLGPTLFNIFINDLPDIFNNIPVTIKLFADDVKLYVEHPMNCAHLQVSLDTLDEWSHVWQIGINAQKTLFCPVSLFRKRDLQPDLYRLCSNMFPPSSSVKDLGVIIDTGLTFVPHIDNITHIAAVRANLIIKSFDHRNRDILLKAYITYVRPLLEYSSPIWNPHHIYLIKQIEKVQRRFTKAFPGMNKIPYLDRLTQLKLATLEHRRLIIDLATCYKILHGYLSTDIVQYLLPSDYLSTRGHPFKLKTSQCKLDVIKYTFTNRIVAPWNSLPEALVLTPSYTIFREGILALNLDKYLRLQNTRL